MLREILWGAGASGMGAPVTRSHLSGVGTLWVMMEMIWDTTRTVWDTKGTVRDTTEMLWDITGTLKGTAVT